MTIDTEAPPDYTWYGDEAMATLKDIAEATGYTKTTVSAALRNLPSVKPETAALIQQTAAKLNYRRNSAAAALSQGRSSSVTIFVSNLADQYYSYVASILASEISNRGYEAYIQQYRNSKLSEEELVKRAAASMSDGVFFVRTSQPQRDITSALNGKPAILFDDWTTPQLFDTVCTPNEEGAVAAIDHLIACGCERIGVIGSTDIQHDVDVALHGKDEPRNTSVRTIRPQTALSTLSKRGYPISLSASQTSNWSFEAGRAAAQHMVDEGLPFDGVFCMNDALALGVLNGLLVLGVHVPDDVAIIGFDGFIPELYSSPTLSTIGIDYPGMIRTAVSMMIRRIEEPDDSLPQKVIAGYRLLKRGSTMR